MKTNIIIPVYNARKTLARTIDSVVWQTGSIRIIAVDDGSTDGSCSILETVSKRYENLLIICQSNAGVAAARNRGLAAADCDVETVLFLDHDDLLIPGALQNLTAALEANPQAVGVFGRRELIDSDDCPLTQRSDYMSGRRTLLNGRVVSRTWAGAWMLPDVILDNCITSPGQALLRACAVRDIGGFRSLAAPSDDWDLYFRLSRISPLVGIEDIVLRYRLSSVQESHNKWKMRRSAFRMRANWLSETTARHRSLIVETYVRRGLFQVAKSVKRRVGNGSVNSLSAT